MSIKVNGPDGLEAWGVALSACFINFVMAGLGRMSGILYVAFIDIFQVDRLQASVPFSARSLARNLLGPVVGILGQKYGVRATTLLGGIIGTLSAVTCFYASNILWITIMWGALNGIGTAMSITLPQVVLGKHFKKYRTTASGMAFSGGCVGSFLFPFMLEYLLRTFGLGGTFLLMGGLIMNVIPAAMMLREPSWLENDPKKTVVVSTISSNINLSQSREWTYSNRKFVEKYSHLGKFSNAASNGGEDLARQNFQNIDTMFLRQENRLIVQLIAEFFNYKDYQTRGIVPNLSHGFLTKKLEKLYSITDEILKHSSTLPRNNFSDSTRYASLHSGKNFNKVKQFSGDFWKHVKDSKEFLESHFGRLVAEDPVAILELFPQSERKYVIAVLHQIHKIYKLFQEKELHKILHVAEQTSQNQKQLNNSNTFLSHLKTVLRLHTNPLFLLISLCRSVHFITFVPAITVIVDFAMDKGLLEEDGKYVIAALSFGDLMGRLCLGWVTDKEYLTLPRALLLTFIAIFSLLQGSLFVRHPVLVSKYLGKNEQSVAMGCFNFFSGLLGFALPSYIGYFRDTIGSYDYIFYINGGIGCAVGIMWSFEKYFYKYTKSDEQ